MITAGLVLAAGLSRRMGEFKPLMRVGPNTLLELSINSMLAGGAQSVVAVLGYRAQEVAAALEGIYTPKQLRLVINRDFETTDMLASIKLGVAALPPCDAFTLLPGDMPAVSRATFMVLHDAMVATHAKVVFPTVEGYRKHPPLIARAIIPDILAYRGTGGLRGIWQAYAGDVAQVPVGDKGCLMDADTMPDFLRLAAYLQNLTQPVSPK